MSITKIKKIINMLLEAEMQSSDNASIDEPYGKILFSPHRTDGVDTTEPNTTEEENLKNAISKQYFDSDSKELGNYAIDMQTMLHKKKYAEILKPTPGYVYRILSNLTLEDVSSIVGESPVNIQKNATDRPWIIEKKITLFPKNDETSLQSWTYNLLKLGFGSFRNNTIELIFEARVEDNYFFMNPHAAKKIDFLQPFKDEHETISAYAVECSRVLIYYTTDSKTTINTELLKKYIIFLNKKGHELENKINKEIIDFYHENGLFLNVEDVSELDIEFNNLSSEDSNKMQFLNKHIIPHVRNPEITSLIIRYFRQLKTNLDSRLKKDFNDKDAQDIIVMYLGFDNPTYYFKKSEEGFYKSGVKFREVSYDYVVKNVKDYRIYSDNSVKNMLYRLFQRKQKY